MPAITNKQRQLTQLFSAFKKGHDVPETGEQPVLEQFLYGICREGATRDLADQAFENLREQFYDWNEVRVSSAREVEEPLADLPEAEPRAERLISFLQEVFEKDFSFDLEGLRKKGLKEAAKELAKYQAANDYVVAWVVQHSLGGHAIPLDLPTLRAARRLGLIDCEADDMEAARASLEHLVPKAKGAIFCDLISSLAGEACWEEEPQCGSCPLAGDCPSAVEAESHVRPVGAGGRGGRVKPR
jgi:endonuclease III